MNKEKLDLDKITFSQRARDYYNSSMFWDTFVCKILCILTFVFGLLFLNGVFEAFDMQNWDGFLSSAVFFVIAVITDYYYFCCRGRNIECKTLIMILEDSENIGSKEKIRECCEFLKKETLNRNLRSLTDFSVIFILLLGVFVSLFGAGEALYFMSYGRNGGKLFIDSVISLLLFTGILILFLYKRKRELFERERLQKYLDNISKIVFYAGTVLFSLFLLETANEAREGQLFGVFVVLAAVIFSAVYINKRKSKVMSKRNRTAFFAFGLILLLSIAGLKVLYEVKENDFEANIPNSGEVFVKISLEEELYENELSLAEGIKSYLIFNDKSYDDGSIIKIDLNKNYSGGIKAEYTTKVGRRNTSVYMGSSDIYFNLTVEDLKKQTAVTEKIINYSVGYAEVTLRFEYYGGFWDVIFY